MMNERDYRSIGEVLALLLEEFPDVTISKIRFLESQGLIQPERTPSGYRKFTDLEVERLRFILREQRENYLPLRIIKDKLGDDSGEISDVSGDISRGLDLVTDISTSGHPAARAAIPRPALVAEQDIPVAVATREARRDALQHAENTESIPRDDLVRLSSIDADFLAELEKAGLVNGHDVGDTTFFDAHSSDIARIAARFRELGVDVRHLKGWKSSAERELALFEQRILPLLRQRNPAAREEALTMLADFIELGGELRAALLKREIGRLTDQR